MPGSIAVKQLQPGPQDLSYNLLTGTIPNDIWVKQSIQEFKVEHNHVRTSSSWARACVTRVPRVLAQMSGTLPEAFGAMPNLFRLRTEGNHFWGPVGAA